MRIWLLSPGLPQDFAGGIRRYMANFARLLGEAGHEVVVVAPTAELCDMMMAPGARLIGCTAVFGSPAGPNPLTPPDACQSYPYNILTYAPALSYQIAEKALGLLQQLPPPDIIEAPEFGAFPYFLLQRKLTERTLLDRVPVVVNLRGPHFAVAQAVHEPRYRFPLYWIFQMEKFCILAADALVSPSHFTANAVKSALRPSLEVAVFRSPLVVPEGPPRNTVEPRHILYVGRLNVHKGVLRLTQACHQLWSAGEEFHYCAVIARKIRGWRSARRRTEQQ
ncbi:MAG: glycosyltransferase family 4 protein [Chloroflexi bacterium]|nr:glycosyltransferase family 4 protein [Chloroflexota bacterium]